MERISLFHEKEALLDGGKKSKLTPSVATPLVGTPMTHMTVIILNPAMSVTTSGTCDVTVANLSLTIGKATGDFIGHPIGSSG